MKFLALLILLSLTLLFLYLMRRGWLNRGRRIVIEHLPELPSGTWDTHAHTHGIYVTSTLAGQPYERVVAKGLGLKSAVDVYVLDEGVLLRRQGAPDLFIPASDLTLVTTTSGMVGKFAAPDSIIVLTWSAQGTPLDTGVHIRSDAERADLLLRLQDLLQEPDER